MTSHIIIYRCVGGLHNASMATDVFYWKMIEGTVRWTQHFEAHEPADYDNLCISRKFMFKEMPSNFLLGFITENFPS